MRLPRNPLRVLFAITMLSSVMACSAVATSPDTGLPTISDAWIRPPMGASLPAAGYLTITNPGVDADALVGVSSPNASSVEIHETTTDGAGMTGMRAVDRIEVHPGAPLVLEPGGYHLMLFDVTDLPATGGPIELTLTFELAGDIVVQAEVRAG